MNTGHSVTVSGHIFGNLIKSSVMAFLKKKKKKKRRQKDYDSRRNTLGPQFNTVQTGYWVKVRPCPFHILMIKFTYSGLIVH